MSQSSIMTNPTNGNLSSPPVPEGPFPAVPESEVLPRARWRSFPAEYKRRILQEADQCTQSGQVGVFPGGDVESFEHGIFHVHGKSVETWEELEGRPEVDQTKFWETNRLE